ncbi:MAG TPA: S8 family peptidase [Chloroflexota bacterium]|nr:S8 family peptidase [Chloroflexota bacterium]
MAVTRLGLSLWGIVVSAFTLLCACAPAAQESQVPPFGEHLTIKLSSSAEIPLVLEVIREAGLGTATALHPLPLIDLVVQPGAAPTVVAMLQKRAEVEEIQRGVQLSAQIAPNDPLYRDYQWDLRRLEMESVWELAQGDPSVIVAVLDTGVDRDHPDLAPNLLSGFDFVNDDPDPSDDGTHGTHVAGIIAAVGNNGEGVTGMAPRSRVLPVKVLDSQGLGPDVAVAKGIIYAVEQGARIINVSSGTPFPSLALKEAVEYADRRGALIVAAAGNTGERDNTVVYPAAYPQVLAVGALDDHDAPAAFSQRQPYVSIAAPGVNIASTIWRAGNAGAAYGSGTGTSAAAPHVSALAALLWSADSRLARDDVRRLILETADDLGPVGRDEATGVGRLNPGRALRSIDAAVRRPIIEPRASTEAAPTSVPSAAAAPLRPVTPPEIGTPAISGPRQWFFADGRTRDDAETRIVLFNPSDSAISGRIMFNTNDGRVSQQPLRVDPFGRLTVWANDYVPDSDFSIKVDADETLYVERTVLFGHDASTLAAGRSASTTWYFAEGRADDVYETILVISNLENRPAQISIRTFGESGPQPEFPITLQQGARVAIEPARVAEVSTFSTIVSSDVPVLVERGVYFDDGRGGDANAGTKAPSRVWYFAEGDTRSEFDATIALFNPNAEPATVKVQIIRTDGRPSEESVGMPGFTRRTLKLDELVPDARFAIRLESDVPIAAERSIYVGGGSHIASGVTQPATEWYLAEGDTIPPFTESVALLNPTDQNVNVELTFYPESGGPPRVESVKMRPLSRGTVDVGRIAPNSRSAARIVADKAIVVERTLYYDDLRGGTSGPAIMK